MADLGRRRFLQAASAVALVGCEKAWGEEGWQPAAGPRRLPARPVLDCHIHLFDPTRPGGIPWPEKTDTVLYKAALPGRYRPMAEALGVVGAIAVECSPLAVDNDWLLATAESSELIVGVIGDLDAALSEFPQELERLRANPLFLGIRYGNLWGRDLGARMREGTFVANLRLLAAKGLVLESANPNPALISALLEVTRKVPELRVIVDHLPQAPPPQDSEIREKYLKDLQELARHPGVFVKGSEILRRIDGKVPERMAVYKAWLDEIWNIFGDDRMLFGSDWPNSDTMAPFANTFNMAKEYIQTRSQKAAEEYWWRNSVRAYGWKPRSAAQKALLKQLSLA